MTRGTELWRKLLPSAGVAAVLAVIVLVVAHQFSRLGERVPAAEDQPKANERRSLPPEASVQEVQVKPASSAEVDLEGEREPTEEELIRQTVQRLLAELRAATPSNPDKVMNFPAVKEELLELLR